VARKTLACALKASVCYLVYTLVYFLIRETFLLYLQIQGTFLHRFFSRCMEIEGVQLIIDIKNHWSNLLFDPCNTIILYYLVSVYPRLYAVTHNKSTRALLWNIWNIWYTHDANYLLYHTEFSLEKYIRLTW